MQQVRSKTLVQHGDRERGTLPYHNLCQSPQKSLPVAPNQFLSAFKHQRLTIQRWAETILQTGEDKGVADVQHWDQQLIEGIKAQNEERYEAAIATKGREKSAIAAGVKLSRLVTRTKILLAVFSYSN